MLLNIEPIDGYTAESMSHGRCDTRPTVTFPPFTALSLAFVQ